MTRVALVTGANRGIGLETARQLLAGSLRVLMAGRDLAVTERARKGLGGDASSTISVRLDVTDVASIAAAVGRAGADTIVWLATLPAGGPASGFFRDRRRIPW